jgi:hypothetical protein
VGNASFLIQQRPGQSRNYQPQKLSCLVYSTRRAGVGGSIADIFDRAKPVLPAASRNRRIECCHIMLNPGGGEFDANSVNQPDALLRYREPLTTVPNARENLDWLVRVPLLPKVPVEESGSDDKRRERYTRCCVVVAMATENRANPAHPETGAQVAQSPVG